ncbi:LOW QUALITY PROTEIN: sigma factor binding protein 2, chloroplastic-like [Curcuma longa]|uniref:LOW QUALITY PROTEIN: sigma factor binding protein 2, chloroplastic-like n=1 Tax=Curcuma longa TaxID=136217 RepID=UPI003D9E27FE
MEKMVIGRHRQCLAGSIAKKKPVKVVYISNPMRFTTSAAAFRGLVQKLTGRDSDPDAIASSLSPNSTESTTSVEPCNSLVAPSEVFDEGFDAQMLMEGFCEFLSSSSSTSMAPPPYCIQ